MSLYIPPSCKLMLPMVKSLVEESKLVDSQEWQHDLNVEVEARLGRLVDGVFVPGVTADLYSTVLKALRTCAKWEAVLTDEMCVDYFFTHGGGSYRTRMSKSESGITIQKSKLQTQTFQMCTQRDCAHRFDIRVSLATESVVQDIPFAVQPDRVRIKRRNQFRYKTWLFDLSTVWTGTSFSQVEARAHSENPDSFEVELECSSVSEAYSKHNNNPTYIALSLILKCMDFISLEYNYFTFVPK